MAPPMPADRCPNRRDFKVDLGVNQTRTVLKVPTAHRRGWALVMSANGPVEVTGAATGTTGRRVLFERAPVDQTPRTLALPDVIAEDTLIVETHTEAKRATVRAALAWVPLGGDA